MEEKQQQQLLQTTRAWPEQKRRRTGYTYVVVVVYLGRRLTAWTTRSSGMMMPIQLSWLVGTQLLLQTQNNNNKDY